MTLSVPAWLLLTVFFYDLIPTFVRRYTWLFYLPNFPDYGQITHTILVRLHQDVLPLFLSKKLWNYSNDCISVSPWVSAVNSPQFFVAWPVFELSFYCMQIFLLFFWSTASARYGLLLWKARKSTEYAFIGVFFLSILIVLHNTRKCCIAESMVISLPSYHQTTLIDSMLESETTIFYHFFNFCLNANCSFLTWRWNEFTRQV